VLGESSDGLKPGQNARRIEHEIENRLAHGHGLRVTVREGIDKLQRLDSSNAHGRPELNRHQFQRDLRALDHELHNKHLLPHLHIVSYGRYLGELVPDAQYVARKGPSHPRYRSHEPQPHTPHLAGFSQAEAGYQRPYRAPARIAGWPAAVPGQPVQPGEPLQSGQPPDVDPPQEGMTQAPDAAAGELTVLKSAIDRAKAGGRPLTIAQIGDSHVEAGTQTSALAERFAQDTGLRPGQLYFTWNSYRGGTASAADQRAAAMLKNINQNTDMVVVSFGSNEAAGDALANQYAQLVSEIRERAPNAAIVMVGPTDGCYCNTNQRIQGLDTIAAAQNSVAASVPNSTYINVGPQMGSVGYLRKNGLMQADNLHLTPDGYQRLGTIVADDIYSVLMKS
jgi:lysophospholipase L1-like esterase